MINKILNFLLDSECKEKFIGLNMMCVLFIFFFNKTTITPSIMHRSLLSHPISVSSFSWKCQKINTKKLNISKLYIRSMSNNPDARAVVWKNISKRKFLPNKFEYRLNL